MRLPITPTYPSVFCVYCDIMVLLSGEDGALDHSIATASIILHVWSVSSGVNSRKQLRALGFAASWPLGHCLTLRFNQLTGRPSRIGKEFPNGLYPMALKCERHKANRPQHLPPPETTARDKIGILTAMQCQPRSATCGIILTSSSSVFRIFYRSSVSLSGWSGCFSSP